MKGMRVLGLLLAVMAVFALAVYAAFCPECGNKVGDDDKFCSKCGAKLKKAEDSGKTDEPEKAEEPAKEPDKGPEIIPDPGMKITAVDQNKDADNQYELARNAVWGPKMMAKNKRDEAEKMLLDILERFPTSDKADDAAYLLGRIYQWNKDYAKAIAAFKKCFELNYKNPEDSLMRIAEIYEEKLKELRIAKEYYQKVLKYDTDETRQKKARDKIDLLAKRGY